MCWRDQIRRWRRPGLCSLLGLAVHGFAIAQTDMPAPAKPAQASTASAEKHHTTTAHSTGRHASSHTTKNSRGKKGKKPGQRAIDSTRARQIQTALIREHYMQGEPSGNWDSASQAAMQRYQADQGWQSKTTPDSRALIKLGLGPSHDHLLNPESAMTATPTPGGPKGATKQSSADDNLPKQ